MSRAHLISSMAVVLAAGCNSFAPSYDHPACGPAGECPDGLTCIAGLCQAPVEAVCGDGVMQGAEVCDDGNQVDGDGCTATCSAATCLVPVTHPTVAAGLADAACPTLYVYSGTYTENVTIARDVTVVAVGTAPVVLDGNAAGTVVTIDKAATVTLRGFTIRNGQAAAGGGIVNPGTLTLDTMTISGNAAVADNPTGGGIENSGILTLTASIVTGNHLTSTVTPGVIQPVLSGAGIHSTAGTVHLANHSSVEANKIMLTGMPGAFGVGGGISAAATTVQITDASMVRNNVVDVDGHPGTGSAQGGGLSLNGGVLTLASGSAIDGNVASAKGVSVQQFGGAGAGAGAGGFSTNGTQVSIDSAFVRNNQVVAISEHSASASVGAGSISNGALMITNSMITGNTVHAAGIGTASTMQDFVSATIGGLNLNGLSATISDARLSSNVVSAETESTVNAGSASVGALATTTFGPSQTVVLQRCTLDGNMVTSADGSAQTGALSAQLSTGSGTVLNVNIVQTTISNNLVQGTSAQNGALSAQLSTGTAMVLNVNVVQTTISNNLVQGTSAQNGAAIATAGTGDTTVNLNFVNSTVSGNRADAPAGTASTGAIAGTTGTGSAKVNVNLASTTVTNNSATGMTTQSGGISLTTGISAAMTTASFKNSIVAGNSAATNPDCASSAAPITSGGYNLLGNAGTCVLTGTLTGNLSGSAGLGPLADNGGPTQTHAPNNNSQVINAGNPASCTDLAGVALTIDQRGFPRVNGGRCDIGAFEH